jgi:spore germination cell wall hydrolase CwlJ-like protein
MQEFHCLSEAVYYEARSETRAGQLAVAEVVLNRVKSKHYPNTVCGVVYQGAERSSGCQFSFTCDGSMDKAPRGKAWDASQKAAQASLMPLRKPLTDRATHYHTVEINPHWAPKMRFEKQIGSHKFYSYKWRERPAASGSSLSVAPPI